MAVVVEPQRLLGLFLFAIKCYNIHETTIPLHPLWTDTF
nr:MAG TPA: hypothetical protein [Caudoviricetes sp.]